MTVTIGPFTVQISSAPTRHMMENGLFAPGIMKHLEG
jgi:hypothetical protein